MVKVLCIKSDCLNGTPGTPGALNNVKKGEYYLIDEFPYMEIHQEYLPMTSNNMYRIYSLKNEYIGDFYREHFIRSNSNHYRDYILNKILK